MVGKAQEKTPVFRTEKRRNPQTSMTYPWIVRTTAMVNHYYFYGIDEDFGPFFLKFCTYFPYNAKLCIDGHEYVKRQLAKEGIAFEALDNGILKCPNPRRLQQLCDDLSAGKIDALLRKWLARLPHPFTPKDRAAGYRYDISILQAEFSLTQVLDQPRTGRIFFEEVIRENLDIGRPDQVQLIFGRRISKHTPGRFRTRVITEEVTPSLHVDYKDACDKSRAVTSGVSPHCEQKTLAEADSAFSGGDGDRSDALQEVKNTAALRKWRSLTGFLEFFDHG